MRIPWISKRQQCHKNFATIGKKTVIYQKQLIQRQREISWFDCWSAATHIPATGTVSHCHYPRWRSRLHSSIECFRFSRCWPTVPVRLLLQYIHVSVLAIRAMGDGFAGVSLIALYVYSILQISLVGSGLLNQKRLFKR